VVTQSDNGFQETQTPWAQKAQSGQEIKVTLLNQGLQEVQLDQGFKVNQLNQGLQETQSDQRLKVTQSCLGLQVIYSYQVTRDQGL
jgi:2-C-methyl-D-erythritol 4-phosphate cytidylyltransferase